MLEGIRTDLTCGKELISVLIYGCLDLVIIFELDKINFSLYCDLKLAGLFMNLELTYQGEAANGTD